MRGWPNSMLLMWRSAVGCHRHPAHLPGASALREADARGWLISMQVCWWTWMRWWSKSTTRLAEELGRMGHQVSRSTVCDLLAQMGYSLQSVRKTREGTQHSDRDAQFRYIADMVAQYQRQRQPVISVDTKKKEMVGDFKNAGREWQPKGQPEPVRVHDFIDPELGKVAPYGVYDVTANEGWVSVGINHDTAEFAVQTIRRWWLEMGRPLYPRARRLLTTADCGGSNGNRVRLWRVQLQQLADELGLTVQ